MGQFDHRPIKLPGGTITSGAELAARGISENSPASVIEMEMNLQDTFVANQNLIDAKRNYIAPSQEVQVSRFIKRQNQEARLSYRMRFFAILFATCAANDYFINDGRFVVFFTFAALGCFFLANPLKSLPKLHDYQKNLGPIRRVFETELSLFGVIYFLASQLIIAFCAFTLYPYTLPEKINKTFQYSGTLKNDTIYVDFSKPQSELNKLYAAKKIAHLYKDGTNVMKIFNHCEIKGCESPDYKAFHAYSKFARNPSTYGNEVCTLIFKDKYGESPLKHSRLEPEWVMRQYKDYSSPAGLWCLPTDKYLEEYRLEQENDNKNLKLVFWSFFVIINLFFLRNLSKSSRWN